MPTDLGMKYITRHVLGTCRHTRHFYLDPKNICSYKYKVYFFTNCLIVIIVWYVLTTYYIIAENGSENYTLHLLHTLHIRKKAGKWLTTENEQ